MTIPLDAIDPEAGYREWVRQYLWHIDQIPALLETVGALATPSIGVSRGGSRFDAVQITGGGYYDNVPIRDGGATADSEQLWTTVRHYLDAVRGHGLATAPVLDPTFPAHVSTARREAYRVNAWLADRVEQIVDWADLGPLEDELFGLIRRMKGRYRGAGTARRARPRVCESCAEAAVVVDWVDGANGSPKPVQVGVCRSCGATYSEGASPTEAAEAGAGE